MKVFTRICIQDWSITAENGDHFEVKRGNEYTTSADRPDGTCKVFGGFWVNVPLECFGGTLPL
jgi:hypothetical protein